MLQAATVVRRRNVWNPIQILTDCKAISFQRIGSCSRRHSFLGSGSFGVCGVAFVLKILSTGVH